MKVLYYDCFSGISGDMNLGALVDVGIDSRYLINELKKLNINEYDIRIDKDVKNGISGTKVDVILKQENNHHVVHNHNDNHCNSDEHEHVHGHKHDCQDTHSHNHEHEHHHRNFKDIEKSINSSSLNTNVKAISLKIFKKVAEAEAKVHNKSIDEVHFHEVGAVDSIVDIVGAAICLDYLKVDKIKCSTVEVGSGFVKCAHGLLPVPAPATAEILKDISVRSNMPFEATTPTGAAILAYAVDEFTDSKAFKIKKIGYGIGNKDNKEVPNVLRVFVGEDECKNNDIGSADNLNKAMHLDVLVDEVEVLECNIDDMNPEMYECVMEMLFKNGAVDVFMTPIIMKKGRPGIKLSVLCNLNQSEKLKEIILTQTTTLGFRMYKVQRNILRRDFSKVKTKYGEITLKNAYYKNNIIKSKPEYDECKRVALDENVSISEVYKEVFSKI